MFWECFGLEGGVFSQWVQSSFPAHQRTEMWKRVDS